MRLVRWCFMLAGLGLVAWSMFVDEPPFKRLVGAIVGATAFASGKWAGQE